MKKAKPRVHDYQAVLEYIIAYKRQHAGESPSHREIGEGCGISSTGVTAYILAELQRQGKLKLNPGQRRIDIPGGRWEIQ